MRTVTTSAEAITREREALEVLIQSEGWQYFTAHLTHEWKGPGFVERLGMAFASGDPLDAKVLYKASLEGSRMINWPEARIRQLKGDTEV
jgi:hypothetical protein